jgi:hypothetical protein
MNSTDFKCPDCDKLFKRTFNLNRHRSLIHGINQQTNFPLCCHICDEGILFRTELVEHLKDVHSYDIEMKEATFLSENGKSQHQS